MDPFSLLANSGNLSEIPDEAKFFIIAVSLLIVFLWVWSLVDVLRRRDFKDSVEKLIWVFVIISTFFLGTVLYYLIGKKK